MINGIIHDIVKTFLNEKTWQKHNKLSEVATISCASSLIDKNPILARDFQKNPHNRVRENLEKSFESRTRSNLNVSPRKQIQQQVNDQSLKEIRIIIKLPNEFPIKHTN